MENDLLSFGVSCVVLSFDCFVTNPEKVEDTFNFYQFRWTLARPALIQQSNFPNFDTIKCRSQDARENEVRCKLIMFNMHRLAVNGLARSL